MSRITRKAGMVDKTISKRDAILPPVDKKDASLLSNTSLMSESSAASTPTFRRFEIPYSGKNISCYAIESRASQLSLVFTQGAGGSIESPCVKDFAEGFGESKNITCFQGRSNLTSRTEMFKTVIEHYPCEVIGGRSMGARTAITTSKEIDSVRALILVSYPLRGSNGDIRDQLLLDIDDGIDVLFVIGSRDTMCDLKKLRLLLNRMKAKTWLMVVSDANHEMKMRPLEATTAVGKMVGRVAANWIEQRDDALTNCEVHWDDKKNAVVVGPWNNGM